MPIPDPKDPTPERAHPARLGTQLVVEIDGASGLDDEALIRQVFLECAEACGATVLHLHSHRFSPQGLTGVAVLAESHICCHTWPELGYGAFDFFMCGDADPWKAVGVLERLFAGATVTVAEIPRGPAQRRVSLQRGGIE